MKYNMSILIVFLDILQLVVGLLITIVPIMYIIYIAKSSISKDQKRKLIELFATTYIFIIVVFILSNTG